MQKKTKVINKIMEPVTLKEIHEFYIMKLKIFLSFLKKHNIKYYAIGGTALGAYRHQGFIPWDEDVDLAMIRSEYEKFITIVDKLDKNHFYISNYRFSNKVEHGLIKICLKDTYHPLRNVKKGYDRSFHIDIFPLDKVPQQMNLQNKQAKRASRLKFLLAIKSRQNSRTKIKTLVLRVIQFVLLAFPSKIIAKKLDILAQKYNYLVDFKEYTNLMGAYSYQTEKITVCNLGEPKKVKFGSINVNVPEKTENFLEGIYGDDFMTPKKTNEEDCSVFGYIPKQY